MATGKTSKRAQAVEPKLPPLGRRATDQDFSPRMGRRATDLPIGPRNVFITRIPGFIGRRLIHQVLASEPHSTVTALVEEHQLPKTKQFKTSLAPNQAKRLQLCTGDVVAMDLRLSGAKFQRLTRQITHIFHLAAIHRLSVEARLAEKVNVGGTRAVLEFARECTGLQRLLHFSSCYVSGDRISVISEEDLAAGQHFRNHYKATKYKAELLCRAAMDELPITVVRPSVVVGDSQTGEMKHFDGIYQVSLLVVTSPLRVPLPMPGDGVAPLNMVPVDYVVNAALSLSRDPRAVGKTFHVVDPNPPSSRAVYELIAAKVSRRVPHLRISTAWTHWLIRIPKLDSLVPQKVQTLHYLNHLAIYNSPNTLELLHRTGIMCPRFEHYADKLVEHLQSRISLDEETAREDPLLAPTPSTAPTYSFTTRSRTPVG